MSFKFCPECGFKLDGIYKFCPECGFKLQDNNINTSKVEVKKEKIDKSIKEKDLTNSFDNLINKKNEYNDLLKKANILCRRKQFDKAVEIYESFIKEDYNDVNAYIGFLRISSKNYYLTSKETEADLEALFSIANKNSNYVEDEEFIAYLKEIGAYDRWYKLMDLESKEKEKKFEERKKKLYKEMYGESNDDLFSGDSLLRVERDKKIENFIKKEDARKKKEKEEALRLEKEEKERKAAEEKRLAEELAKKKEAELKKTLSLLNLDKTQSKLIGIKSLKEKKLIIPDCITSIEPYAFRNNPTIEEIFIPESVTNIAKGAFENCTKLKKINLPSKISNISNSMFKNCKSLSSINIPNSVISIEDDAFAGCTSLSDINNLNNVSNFGKKCFYGCSKLPRISVFASNVVIGEEAFAECEALTSFECASVIEIANKAFSNCTSLSLINLKDTKSIGDFAFLNAALKIISLTKKLEHVGTGAFACNGTIEGFILPLDRYTRSTYYVENSYLCHDNGSRLNTYKTVVASAQTADVLKFEIIVNEVAPYTFYKLKAKVIDFKFGIGPKFNDNSFVSCKNLKGFRWIGNPYFDEKTFKDCDKFNTIVFGFNGYYFGIKPQQFVNFKQLKKVVYPSFSSTKIDQSYFCNTTKIIMYERGVTSYEI